jgi:hypothetical protein
MMKTYSQCVVLLLAIGVLAALAWPSAPAWAQGIHEVPLLKILQDFSADPVAAEREYRSHDTYITDSVILWIRIPTDGQHAVYLGVPEDQEDMRPDDVGYFKCELIIEDPSTFKDAFDKYTIGHMTTYRSGFTRIEGDDEDNIVFLCFDMAGFENSRVDVYQPTNNQPRRHNRDARPRHSRSHGR